MVTDFLVRNSMCGATRGSLVMDLCERMLEISLGRGTAAMCLQTVSVSGRAAEEFG